MPVPGALLPFWQISLGTIVFQHLPIAMLYPVNRKVLPIRPRCLHLLLLSTRNLPSPCSLLSFPAGHSHYLFFAISTLPSHWKFSSQVRMLPGDVTGRPWPPADCELAACDWMLPKPSALWNVWSTCLPGFQKLPQGGSLELMVWCWDRRLSEGISDWTQLHLHKLLRLAGGCRDLLIIS